MAKKSFLSHLGTCLIDVCLLTMLYIVYNPLSLFVINLFYPKGAALMAKNPFCGEKIRGIYTELAMMWPFLWSKYWMTPEQIKDCTPYQQLSYYLRVNQTPDTVYAMSEEALKVMIKEAPEGFIWMVRKGRFNDELFTEMLDQSYRGKANIRLLDEYFRHGTLPKTQFMILITKAASSSYVWENHPLVERLLSYIENCGLGNKILPHLKEVQGTSLFMDSVLEKRKVYDQKWQTRHLSKLKDDDEILVWEVFCAKEKLCEEAQKEMSTEQYRIFHAKKQCLTAGAIYHLLDNHPDWEMKRLIFLYEKDFAIQNKKIGKLVDGNEKLKALWLSVVEEIENELFQTIRGGKMLLSCEETSRMFACPKVHELFKEYCQKWPEEQDKLLQDLIDYHSLNVSEKPE